MIGGGVNDIGVISEFIVDNNFDEGECDDEEEIVLYSKN